MKVEDGMTPEQRAAHEHLKARGQEIAALLDGALNPEMAGPLDVAHRRHGFALLLFTFGEEGAATYVSNADRGDMIRAVEEWLKHAKRRS